MSDEELLLRIKDHDLEALSLLYDRYSRPVFGILIALLRDTDEAEDATQEVFLRTWNKAETFQTGITSTKAWLLRVAHNLGLNLLRARRIRQQRMVSGIEAQVLENIPDDSSEGAWHEAARSEELAILSNALQRLSGDQRELIELAFLKGHTHSEIASITKLPLGTIKTRIRAALKVLRFELKPLQQEFR